MPYLAAAIALACSQPPGPRSDLEENGAALATARVHGREAQAAASPAQLVDQRGHQASAGRRDRVTDAAPGSADVHELGVQAELLARRDWHHRDGLVDLPQQHLTRPPPPCPALTFPAPFPSAP